MRPSLTRLTFDVEQGVKKISIYIDRGDSNQYINDDGHLVDYLRKAIFHQQL
jgi:hypothetical protein